MKGPGKSAELFFPMKKKCAYVLIFGITLLCIASCKRRFSIKPMRAFYYWRSNFRLSNKDVNYLKDVEVDKLYIHFFDVNWNDLDGKVLPEDEVTFDSMAANNFQLVPVVFITTKALKETNRDSILGLSRHIFDEVEHLAKLHNVIYNELQVDCDWTEGTREKYFSLLLSLDSVLRRTGKLLSATIRLHQVKYKEKTGVPPVDRGMLMFYNMGNVNSIVGYNSIYNGSDADKYASYIKSYTLPLDVALPIFGWAICFRDGKVKGIIEKAVNTDYWDTSHFVSAGNNIFVARKDFFLHARYFIKNDTVKLEEVSPDLCEDAAQNVSQYLRNENRTVTLFEYDSLYLSSYDKKDLEKIFSLSN